MHLSAQKIIDDCYAILSNSEFNVEDINMETDTVDAMLPPEDTSFIVIECKRAIHQNNNRVCVPKTWITCNIIPGRKVAFGYPAEDEDSIAIRVRNKERPDYSWKTHIGVIQFESESYEDAVGYLQPICGENSEQIEDYSNQKSYEEAAGSVQTICGENSELIEDDSNQKSHEDAVGYLQPGNSELIEDNSNQKSPEEAVGYLQSICGEKSEEIEDYSNQKFHEDAVGYLQPRNSELIEDNSNQKSHEDSVGYPQTICGENSKQIEEKSNTIEPVIEPKNPLKLRIVIPKLDQKSEKKKKSEKKHHKKHSKDKGHKSKRRYMEQLSLTDNITQRSSPNSVDTRVRTESCMSCQSNYQSSESSPKSLESEISNTVHSAPETHLKNNNNNSYSSKRILLESLDDEKENNDGMLSEDRQLVENMYLNIIRHVQYMKTTALAMKKSHLIAMEHREILNKIAAKYKIPLPPVSDPVEREDERKGDPFEEENLQYDEMETQDDDNMENESQVTEQNDNASEENLLEERENPEGLLDSDSDNQMYTDDESIEDDLPSSPEVVKYRGKTMSKANNTWTLKHPRPGKGLIRIGRHSHVYISADGLKKAKRTCTDVKQFARQLYKEAFTPKALGTCSMTGFTRPALHYEARTILKKYAVKYGRDMWWDSLEPKELEQNLSKFLANTRRDMLKRKKHVDGKEVNI